MKNSNFFINLENKIIKLFLLIVFTLSSVGVKGQTTIIDSLTIGGFETDPVNNWYGYSGAAVNKWWIGNIPTGTNNHTGFTSGTNCAFISDSSTGAIWRYSFNNTSVVHLYRNITFPAGETNAHLYFKWKAYGITFLDELLVSLSEVSNPVLLTGETTDIGTGIVDGTTLLGRYSQLSSPITKWENITIPISAIGNCSSAKTYRLVFTWKNNASGGTNPPIAIDNVHLTSATPPITYSGTYTIGAGGNFSNLTAAWAAINNQTISGPLVFEILNTYSGESSYPLNLTPIYSCGNSITIRPALGVSKTITSNAAYTINLNGVDNLIIDGRAGGVGNTQDLIISNTSLSGIALRFNDGATYNKIQYCTLQSVNTGSSSGTVSFAGSTTTEGNSFNTIDNCDIKDGSTTPYNGIVSAGSGTIGLKNISDTISNCNIYNFFNASGGNGILMNSNNDNWVIKDNSLYQTVDRFTGNTSIFHFIQLNNTGGSHLIQNNYLGGTAPNATGGPFTITSSGASRLTGIQVAGVSTTTPTNVDGNVISNISFTTNNSIPGAPGVWSGVFLNGGQIRVGKNQGNTIGKETGNASISITNTATSGFGAYSYGISSTGNAMNLTVSNNKIGSITATSTALNMPHSLAGISIGGCALLVADSNIIGSIYTSNSLNAASSSATSTTAQKIIGIEYEVSNTASLGNNIIANLNNAYTASNSNWIFRGISNNSTNGVNTIYNNQIYNISTATQGIGVANNAGMIGIHIFNTTFGGQNVYGNNIYNLVNTAATGAVRIVGIYYLGNSSGINSFHKNKIHSFQSTAVASLLYGIYADGGNATYYNNMIRLGLDSAGNSITLGLQMFGIYEVGTSNNFYNNTVYIGGDQVDNLNNNTYAIYSTVVSFTRNYKNNLLVSTRSNLASGGKHYCIRLGGTSPNPTGLTNNYNNFFVSGNDGKLGLYNGVDYSSLSGWAAATGKELNSGIVTPYFINATGNSSQVNLHLLTDANDALNNTGTPIPIVTADFDNELRDLATPDVGADEFVSNFVVYTYADSYADSCDFEQLHTNHFIPESQTGTWSVTFGSGTFSDDHDPDAFVTGLSVGSNIYRWTVSAGTSFGYDEVEVIKWELSGTYTVGVGQDFSTIKEACNISSFACLLGPVTFLLTDSVYDELDITIWRNIMASSTNTLTIKPAPNVNAEIHLYSGENVGILMLGAKNIIIDGSNNNSGSRNLSLIKNDFPNILNVDPIDVIIKLEANNISLGSEENTIKNVEIKGRSIGALTADGVIDFGIIILNIDGTCNNNRIENCKIDSVSNGIFTQRNAIEKNRNNKILNNAIFTNSGPSFENFQYTGIVAQGEDSLEISGNIIGGMLDGRTDNVYGICAGKNPFSYGPDANLPNEVTNTNIFNNSIYYTAKTGLGIFNSGITIHSGATGVNSIFNNSVNINADPNLNFAVPPGSTVNTGNNQNTMAVLLYGEAGSTNQVYHNTIRINIDSTGFEGTPYSTRSYAIFSNDELSNTDIRNNIIISNPETGSKSENYVIGLGYNTYSNLICNNNNFFPGQALGNFHYSRSTTGDFGNLSLWQTETGQDLNSNTDTTHFIVGDYPHLEINTNCHLEGTGAPVGVLEDLDGDIRNTVTPDMGADEFDGVCTLVLNLKMYIEGFYLGGGTMSAVLDPVNLPFVCDEITVELHDTLTPYNVVYSLNGTININGIGQFNFPPSVLNQSYYVVVKHRNSIETWSKNAVLFDTLVVEFDFTN